MPHPLTPANAGIQFHWLSSNISLVSRFRAKERSGGSRFKYAAQREALRFRVAAAFLAEAERAEAGREAEALPPILPPLREGEVSIGCPRPEPVFLPPPVSLFTVAQARRSASLSGRPRDL